MNESDAANALGKRLEESPDVGNIFWSGSTVQLPKKPYVVFQNVPVSSTDDTLEGGFEILRGYVSLTVVRDLSSFRFEDETGGPKQFAAYLKSLFPYGDRLTENGTLVTIIKPPFIQQSFRDGNDIRVVVRIDYQAQ